MFTLLSSSDTPDSFSGVSLGLFMSWFIWKKHCNDRTTLTINTSLTITTRIQIEIQEKEAGFNTF